MCNCKECDNLYEDYLVEVIDVEYNNPFMQNQSHFVDGFKCTWNGIESAKIEDLQKGSCRCRGDGL